MSAKSSFPGARWSPIISFTARLFLMLESAICKSPFSIFFRTFVGSSSN